jgi:formylglycine-generating enzyme required for sulfatase activity
MSRRAGRIAPLSLLLVLTLLIRGCAEPHDGPRLAIELDVEENRKDGCTSCGCRTNGALEPTTGSDWWIAFGAVAADPETGWRAVDRSSRCGSGSFEAVGGALRETIGEPHLVVDLETQASLSPTGGGELRMHARIRRLSELDENGRPVYAESQQTRLLAFEDEGSSTFPLLIADPREAESFGVHDVLLRVRATLLGDEPAASYGSLSVSADVPGAEVLLDGGFVGRIAAGEPTLLANVRAGTREVRVRDFSGREASQSVVVEPGSPAQVSLQVLDLGDDGAGDLVPIGRNPQGYEEYWRKKDAAMMVRVPAGEFLMGSPDDQGAANERPQHRVQLSEFLIDKTEVTWRQFKSYAAATGAQLPREPVSGSRSDYPVSFVLWEDARGYCEWVGARLPSEAEWEKAARGSEGGIYPWGDVWDPGRCNSIRGGRHQPESAGSLPGCVSPYGLLDMAGSMWEWCADWWGEHVYQERASAATVRDPQGPSSGDRRVLRGGAWMSLPSLLRAAYRRGRLPSSANVDHGFRCARNSITE